ncbi:hypothetical protein [Burkholderia phage FLC9]|nr:hypothetical protein [Burkholderia phage FLC9]
MNPNEVKGFNDLQVWLKENLSALGGTMWVDLWVRDMKHLINYDYMVGASRIETEVKELSMVTEGWKLVMRCEAKETLLEGMQIDPITVVGYFRTDYTGRIIRWEGLEIIR